MMMVGSLTSLTPKAAPVFEIISAETRPKKRLQPDLRSFSKQINKLFMMMAHIKKGLPEYVKRTDSSGLQNSNFCMHYM